MRFLIFITFLLVASTANAAEWIVYGQTSIPSQGSVNNPMPNAAGVVGEVVSLPYTVPAGFELRLMAYGIEAYNRPGTAVIFPWLGAAPATNAKALMSVGAHGITQEIIGAVFHLPAGTIVNFMLLNGQDATQVYAWYAFGELVQTGQ